MTFNLKPANNLRKNRRARGVLPLALSLGACLGGFAFFSQTPAWSSAYFDLQDQWIKTFNEGVTALDSNLYGKAEPLLKDAVSLSERFGAGDPRYPKSLGELGRLYTIRRRYAEAEPVLEQQLHFTEVQLGKNSGKTIPALGQMIKFYMLYGTASKADPLAEELLGFIDGKLREDAELNASNSGVGKGKVLTGWAGTAPPATHIPRMDWAVTCDRLGDLYRYRKKFEMAERFYKAGLDIKVTIMGKEHMSMAVSYDNLGMLALDKEEFRDAEDYFRESLETTQKIMGNGDPDTYARLDRLAKALIREKKFDEAAKTYQQALQLWKNEPNSGGATARCLYQLGSMECDQGRYGEAAGLLSRALNLSIKANGQLSYSNVPYMRKLAYALYYCGRRGESDGLKARANWLAEGMEDPTPVEKTADKAAEKSAGKTAEKTPEKGAEKTAEKAAEKTGDKTAKAGEKTAAKPGDKTGGKPGDKPGSRPGDKSSAVASSEEKGKTGKGGKIEKMSEAYDPDKRFIKPGMSTAADTIKTMREQGKSGPMKQVAEDEDEKPMNLLKMTREAAARESSKPAEPQQVAPPPVQPSTAAESAAAASSSMHTEQPSMFRPAPAETSKFMPGPANAEPTPTAPAVETAPAVSPPPPPPPPPPHAVEPASSPVPPSAVAQPPAATPAPPAAEVHPPVEITPPTAAPSVPSEAPSRAPVPGQAGTASP